MSWPKSFAKTVTKRRGRPSTSSSFEPHVHTPDAPRLVGGGSATFSTSVALARVYRFAYDTNCYYRSLDVTPGCSRLELLNGYVRVGGEESPYLTKIFKYLLDPVTRARYDATPFTTLHQGPDLDEWAEIEFKSRLREQETYLRETGMFGFLSDEQLQQFAYERLEERGETLGMTLDGQDPEEVLDPFSEPYKTAAWPFAYYLWLCDDGDVDKLRAWLDALIRAFAVRGVVCEIAVGLHGPEASAVATEVIRVGRRLVIFLDAREDVTDTLAQRVVSRVVTEDL